MTKNIILTGRSEGKTHLSQTWNQTPLPLVGEGVAISSDDGEGTDGTCFPDPSNGERRGNAQQQSPACSGKITERFLRKRAS